MPMSSLTAEGEKEGEISLVDAPRVRSIGRSGRVEVVAAVLASDDESPAAAKRRAMTRARQAAIEHAAGVSVRSSLVTLDHVSDGETSDLLQALTATQARALIVDEKLIESKIEMSPKRGYRARVTMQATVLEHRQAEAGFETEVRLNGDQFHVGDRVELAIRVSEAARLYVLAVSDEGASVLLPNRHRPDTRIEADTWFEFPGDELEGRGVSLTASLSGDRERSREALVVVALRGNRRLEGRFRAPTAAVTSGDTVAGEAGMKVAADFLAPLLSMPAKDWSFHQVVYGISRD